MSSAFQDAYRELIQHEGSYSNDPVDQGGETYRGISRVFHPDWPGWSIVDEYKDDPSFPGVLDKDLALQAKVQDFYKEHHWDVFHGDDLPVAVAWELFEIGVNMGVRTATKFLQRALNVFNKQGTLWPDIAIDGVFGPATLRATQAMCSARSGRGSTVLAKSLNCLQGERYISIGASRPSQERFLWGWFNRVS